MSVYTVDLISSFKNLKKGALLVLVSQILGFLVKGVELTIVIFRLSVDNVVFKNFITYCLLILHITLIIFGIIGFATFLTAVKYLKKYDPNYGIGLIGAFLQLIGLLFIFVSPITFLLTILQVLSAECSGKIVFFVNQVFLVMYMLFSVGGMFFGIMLISMDKIDQSFKIAGTLYLIGAILYLVVFDIGAVFTMISLMLIYKSSDRIIKEPQKRVESS
ncbi:DUF973 family protein [Archaeoglobus sp.]